MTVVDPSGNTKQVAVGEVLADRYRVERFLGQGAMGYVVEVTHTDLGERRAVKILHPAAAQDSTAQQRFVREARAAAKLTSPHVVKVVDFGRTTDGGPFMVMEYLEGEDLKAVLDRSGALPIGTAIDYMLQALHAIGEAHAAGIVHRDLKPGNLYLTKTKAGAPLVKVLDFGVAKMSLSASLGEMTMGSETLGSPLYMSPEQVKSSKNVDARSDIWACGVLLFRLMTAKTPFTGDSIHTIMLSILQDEPVRPSEIRPDVPKPLEAIIMRCLEKDPGRRFQSCDELVRALEWYKTEGSKLAAAPTSTAPKLATQVMHAVAPGADPPRAHSVPAHLLPQRSLSPAPQGLGHTVAHNPQSPMNGAAHTMQPRARMASNPPATQAMAIPTPPPGATSAVSSQSVPPHAASIQPVAGGSSTLNATVAQPSPPQKKSKASLFVGLVLGLGLLVGAFFVVRPMLASKPTQKTAVAKASGSSAAPPAQTSTPAPVEAAGTTTTPPAATTPTPSATVPAASSSAAPPPSATTPTGPAPTSNVKPRPTTTIRPPTIIPPRGDAFGNERR